MKQMYALYGISLNMHIIIILLILLFGSSIKAYSYCIVIAYCNARTISAYIAKPCRCANITVNRIS